MKQVLLLGAGLVARPLVRYLLDQPEFFLTIATIEVDKAEKMTSDHPRSLTYRLDVEDSDGLRNAIQKADIVISLLPYIHHVKSR
jgi:saccharopine dehydrogenase (NADP+, L-glutamate forming)